MTGIRLVSYSQMAEEIIAIAERRRLSIDISFIEGRPIKIGRRKFKTIREAHEWITSL